MNRNRAAAPVHAEAGRIEPGSAVRKCDVHGLRAQVPPSKQARGAHTGNAATDRRSGDSSRIAVGGDEPGSAHPEQSPMLDCSSHSVIGETGEAQGGGMCGAVLRTHPVFGCQDRHFLSLLP